MKSVVFILAIALFVSVCTGQSMQRIEGETRCKMGPFMMEARDDCNCASDGMHFTCNYIARDPPAKPAEKIEGTTKCTPGPFKIEARQCHCASDYKHFTCPES